MITNKLIVDIDITSCLLVELNVCDRPELL